MKSIYKNATKELIQNKLVELGDEQYPFNRPTLQKDTFWIYCIARRYYGTYRNALLENGIDVPDGEIRNEYGYPIDNWTYIESHNQREWLALALQCLELKCINYSPKSLKYSPYFDIYTDAVNLFGKYETAKEYAGVTKKPSGIEYPENEETFIKIIEMYTSGSNDKRCEILKQFDIGIDGPINPLERDCTDCPVLVDGSNVSYVNGRISLENLILVDNYIQELGFKKDNIIIFVDASFPRWCGIDLKDFEEFRKKDPRYCMTPAKEQADPTILTYAYDLLQENPDTPPLIITGDMYDKFFEDNPKFEVLKQHKRGVSWIFKQKKPTPVINLIDINL